MGSVGADSMPTGVEGELEVIYKGDNLGSPGPADWTSCLYGAAFPPPSFELPFSRSPSAQDLALLLICSKSSKIIRLRCT